MRRVFERPRNGLRIYDYDPDDGMFLRGSGSFKFSAHPREPRQGFVRIVGSPGGYRVEVFADMMKDPLKKSFGPVFLRQHKRLARRDLRSPKIRKFAAYAVRQLELHFLQLGVNEVHER
jgi:hypothetical protein